MSLRLCSLAVLVLSLASPAQTASYTFFGSGCASPAVTFQVVGVPKIGGAFVVQTDPPSLSQFAVRTVFVITGASNQSLGGVPLPFDLAPLSGGGVVFCGSVLTSSEIVLPSPPDMGSGYGELKFPVPNSPSLLGAVFYQQVLVSNRVRGGSTTISTSQGGQATIGL